MPHDLRNAVAKTRGIRSELGIHNRIQVYESKRPSDFSEGRLSQLLAVLHPKALDKTLMGRCHGLRCSRPRCRCR